MFNNMKIMFSQEFKKSYQEYFLSCQYMSPYSALAQLPNIDVSGMQVSQVGTRSKIDNGIGWR